MKATFSFYRIGHFFNRPDDPTDFEIARFDELEEPEIEDPHKHTFYEILWFEAGETIQVIDYETYPTAGGMLFFLSPGQLHHFENWQPMRGGSVFFDEAFFLFERQDHGQLFEMSFLDNFFEKPFLRPEKADFEAILQTIELLRTEKKRADWSRSIASSLLNILLLQIQRAVDSEKTAAPTKPQIVLFKKLKALIDLHFHEPLTANFYAEKLQVTPHHLNLTAQKTVGKTTTELIRARAILEAKRLLTFSDQPVSEVAAGLGFYDLSYFSKIFRTETGLAPLEFRKAMSEKYRNLNISS